MIVLILMRRAYISKTALARSLNAHTNIPNRCISIVLRDYVLKFWIRLRTAAVCVFFRSLGKYLNSFDRDRHQRQSRESHTKAIRYLSIVEDEWMSFGVSQKICIQFSRCFFFILALYLLCVHRLLPRCVISQNIRFVCIVYLGSQTCI